MMNLQTYPTMFRKLAEGRLNVSRHFIFSTKIKLEKDVFRLVTSVGQRKILSPCEESNLRPLYSALRRSGGRLLTGTQNFFFVPRS